MCTTVHRENWIRSRGNIVKNCFKVQETGFLRPRPLPKSKYKIIFQKNIIVHTRTREQEKAIFQFLRWKRLLF